MVKAIARLVLLAIAGAIIGMIVLLFIGGWYALWLVFSKLDSWEQFLTLLAYLPTMPIFTLSGMFMAFNFWHDWVIFAAAIGCLTVLFFSLMKRCFPTHSKTVLGITILFLTISCLIFSWQRQRTIEAIKMQYINFCTAIREDQQAAYAELSPVYRHTISFQSFRQELQDDGSAFSRGCNLFPHISAEWDVSITGNHATFFRNKLDFSDPLAGGMTIDLEKIDGEWYFDDEPSWYGLD